VIIQCEKQALPTLESTFAAEGANKQAFSVCV